MSETKLSTLLILLFMFTGMAMGDYRIRETNRHYEPGDWTTWSCTRFVRHVSLGQQYVYFSTTGGITRYDFFKEKWDTPFTISNGLADQNIYVTARDAATGFLWCIRETGVSYMEPASLYWFNAFYDEMSFGFDEHAIAIGFGSGNVYLLTAENNLYSAMNTSLSFFQIYDIENIDVYSNQFGIQWSNLHDNHQGKLDYMYMDHGYFFDEKSHFIKDMQFRQYNITGWVQDPWNKIWLATWGLGAAKGDVFSQRLELLPFGLFNETVDFIAPEKGKFWLGGIQNVDGPAGVTLWDPNSKSVTYFDSYLYTGFDEANVTSIAVDGDIVWYGTQNGLVRYNRKRDNWRTLTEVDNLVDNYVYDVAVDGKRVWAATHRGVSYMEKDDKGEYPGQMKLLNYPALRNMRIYDIERQQNLLWLATEYGIYIHDTVADSGGFYSGDIGPEDRTIYALSVYKDEVWFGTEDGVEAFNSAAKQWLGQPARMYHTGAGINRILATDKAVWVATEGGVLKYDREREYWVEYTVEDGLPSDMVLSLYPDGDYIWFGTEKGLTRFYWNSPWRVD